MSVDVIMLCTNGRYATLTPPATGATNPTAVPPVRGSRLVAPSERYGVLAIDAGGRGAGSDGGKLSEKCVPAAGGLFMSMLPPPAERNIGAFPTPPEYEVAT